MLICLRSMEAMEVVLGIVSPLPVWTLRRGRVHLDWVLLQLRKI